MACSKQEACCVVYMNVPKNDNFPKCRAADRLVCLFSINIAWDKSLITDHWAAGPWGGRLPVTTCYSVTVDQILNWTSHWFLMCLDCLCWKKHIKSIQHSIWREEFRNWTWPTIRTFLSVRSWRGSSACDVCETVRCLKTASDKLPHKSYW